MIIKRMFVDEFSGNEGLGLEHLDSHLNVIKVPSPAEANVLRRFIPSILYGPSADADGGQAVVCGSIEAVDPIEGTVDLSRMPIDGANRSSDLHVLNDRGQLLETGTWREAIDQVDQIAYLSVFTDIISPTQRLDLWSKNGWLKGLVDRSSPEETPDDTAAPPSLAPAVVERRRERIRLKCEQLSQEIDSLIQQRRLLRSQRETTGSERSAYLAARAELQECEARRQTALAALQATDRDLMLVTGSLELSELWEQLRELRLSTAAADDAPPRAETLAEVVRLQGAQREVRKAVQEARKQIAALSDRTAASSSRHSEHITLLSERSAVLDREQRILRLRKQLAKGRNRASAAKTYAPEQIQRIRFLHQRAQVLRLATTEYKRCEDEATAISGALDVSTVSPLGSEIERERTRERLRQEIHRLRGEALEMQASQSLDRLTFIKISSTFAVGVALLLISVLSDLNGANLVVGAVGLACTIGAALVRARLQHEPSSRLVSLQRQIANLTREVRQFQTVEGGTGTTLAKALNIADAADRFYALEAANEDLQSATDAWHAALTNEGLSVDLRPRQAVAELRRRLSESMAARPTPSDQLVRRQRQLRTAVKRQRQWRTRAARACGLPDDHAHSSGQLIALLEAQLADVTEREVNRTNDIHRHHRELRRQLTELRNREHELLSSAGVATAEELRQRLVEAQVAAERRQALIQLSQDFEQQIRQRDDADQLRALLESESRQALLARHVTLTHRLRTCHEDLASFQRDHEKLTARLTELVTKPEPNHWRQQQSMIDEQIRQLRQQWNLRQLTLSLLDRVSYEPAKPKSADLGDLMPTASEYLRSMIDDRSVEIRWDHACGTVLLVTGDNRRRDFDALDAGEQTQVIFAIQFSLIHRLRDRDIRLPLVLVDDSLGDEAGIAFQMSRALRDLGNSGQQIVMITSRTDVAHRFRYLGIGTLVVTRRVHNAAPPQLGASSTA